MQKILSQILPSIDYELVSCDGKSEVSIEDVGNILINDLVFDSREVKEGSLFFALPGLHVDGNSFIPNAIKNGANAIVYQGEIPEDVKIEAAKACVERHFDRMIKNEKGGVFPAFIKVRDTRISMAPLSDCFYNSPSKRLIVIGVTGTEGKSSTVSFIWQLLKLCGKKAGFISTVEYSFGEDALPNPQHQTTPEAPIIQHHLSKMLENGCQYAVVESSSHGLSKKLNRLGNVYFDCAVFMNVTLEHLEFHKNFETYRSDKANLFRALDFHDHIKVIAGEKINVPSIGIVNLEDNSAQYFIDSTKKDVYGFTTLGKAGKNAFESEKTENNLLENFKNIKYLIGKNINSSANGLEFDVEFSDKNSSVNVKSSLPGAFNAYNIMASLIAVSSVTDISIEEISQKVKDLIPIKGRMTVIDKNQPFEVIVDYAHTPSSFETIFPPIKKRCSGKIFAVFGSGGERDLTKRPIQGEIAGKYCDCVILADEDPRGENPEELLKQIAVGSEKVGKVLNENLFIIPDRKKAIRQTFKMAKENDIVLLLGKSHENSIIYKDFVMPYDEIQEAEDALSEMGYK